MRGLPKITHAHTHTHATTHRSRVWARMYFCCILRNSKMCHSPHINQSRAARAQVPMKPGGKYNEPASVPTALVEEWATFLATQGAGSLWACPIFGLVTASSDEISRVRGARLVCVCAPPRFFCHLRRRARAVK